MENIVEVTDEETLPAAVRGQLHAVLARLAWSDHDRAVATREANLALELDEGNTEAHLVLAEMVGDRGDDPTEHYVASLDGPHPHSRALASLSVRVPVEELDDAACEYARRYREAAARPGALTAMINYYRGILRGGGSRRMAARGFPIIETPTLMVWGEADPILLPSSTNDAGEWVKDLTRRFLPGVGHWVQQEAPDEVNEILAAWLTDAPVPEAPR